MQKHAQRRAPHIEINDINIHNKRPRQKSSNSLDPSRQHRYIKSK